MGDYAAITVDSSNWIKRWSHRARFTAAMQVIRRVAPRSVLDYGAGDGMLRHLWRHEAKDQEWTLFEPIIADQTKKLLAGESVEIITDMVSLGRQFDLVICQEVLEHLPCEAFENAVCALKDSVRAGGYVFVSVPIEIGPASLGKNLVRLMMQRPHENTNLRTVLASLMYRSHNIKRVSVDGYIFGHLGFDYRTVMKCFSDGYDVVSVSFSPLGWTHLFNSQYNLLLKKHE